MYWAPSMSDSEGQTVSGSCFEESLGEVSLAMQAWGDWSTDPAVLADVVSCVERSTTTRSIREPNSARRLVIGC